MKKKTDNQYDSIMIPTDGRTIKVTTARKNKTNKVTIEQTMLNKKPLMLESKIVIQKQKTVVMLKKLNPKIKKGSLPLKA